MLQPSQKLIQLSALLLTVGAIFRPFLETLAVPAQAQSTSPNATFPLPTSLPGGAIVEVDGSSSMAIINELLKKRFTEKFPGTTVNFAENGSDEAVKALLDGRANLAAIGRPLTAQEKAKGLILAPVSREKIAIIVGADNPFKGNVTFEQFARMFRGEITDWSQAGGQPGRIRFIDRPETSDTRRSLSNYKVFQSAPFENGATTTRLTQDDTASVVKELGTDGIGYAIADHVKALPGVRVLEMHGTLPDDPRYPYSQPRGYVYKQGVTDPATLAFLGFVTSKPGQEILQEAKQQEVEQQGAEQQGAIATSPEATLSPSPTPTTATALAPATTATVATETKQGFPWWLWLLGIPLLGGLFWWLLKGRGGEVAPVATTARPVPSPAPVPTPVPIAKPSANRIVLTPRNCRDAYAYWEVSDQRKAELRRQGGRNLALRLYDVTGIDLDLQRPHSVREFECQETETDRHLPIEHDDRDYLVDLGYVTDDGRWLRLARSAQVHVPACLPTAVSPNIGGVAALAGGAAAVGAGMVARSQSADRPRKQVETGSRIILTPRNSKDAYAYWEANEADRSVLRRQGGKKMMLRLYDVTDINMDDQYPHSVQQFDVSEADQDKHLPIPVSDRDYIVEVGYVTEEGRWLKLARSNHVRVPAEVVLSGLGAIAGGTALVGAGIATQSAATDSPSPKNIVSDTSVVPSSPTMEGKCAIQELTVHSRKNCYLLNADQMRQLENNISVPKSLASGSYIVRLKSGTFSYHVEGALRGEPLVLLWIHGGRFINQKTNVPVNATWSTLNGYDETLCLEVLEPATLHAFFFDTYIEDNTSEVIVSVIQHSSTYSVHK
ncbi:DUF4912 domain-containing protein [Leptothermofonsia sp. ETS-13]|uniref:DUF4912 domain-containing protein n=1 Tax=Leptothermofonsia sp. ETS-13 TaxID=3035696 RepID=UPI003BA3C803